MLRNTPLTLVLLFFAFVLPQLAPRVPYFAAALVGLTLYTAPFVAEALPSGVNGVPIGQAEAARSLGMGFGQALTLIILPQAFRMVIPPLVNVLVALAKNTSVADGFFGAELFTVGKALANADGNSIIAILPGVALAAALALAIGVAFATLRTSVFAWMRVPATVVLEFFRGMPVLLLMLFILLASSFGAFWAVVLGLALYDGAIIGEILRAGLASLPRGQREAGLSLGLTRLQTKTMIEFPQAFRQMLPVIVARLVVLLKDTSLGHIVGYNELIRTTMNSMSSFYGNRSLLSLFIVTLVIYLAIDLSLSALARRLARKRISR